MQEILMFMSVTPDEPFEMTIHYVYKACKQLEVSQSLLIAN